MIYRFAIAWFLTVCSAAWLPADETSAATAEPTPDAKSTAVAMNYCRAAFHRIRKDPTPEILKQEQEKILNNLNLTQLEDAEVVKLYTTVLDEINQITVSEDERTLYQQHHRASIQRQVTWDALAFGTDLMTAQFGSAIRTGANSWWDYRNKSFQRDLDLMKIDKTRLNSFVQRSSQFLDTFWKLAREKNIPDRWMVRNDDLDQLDAAMQETDPEVRLRVLKRMQPYMEAYPPYWYYLARTEQELGNVNIAIETYAQLEQLGAGHFRKDDMLATAMANRAAIEDQLGSATALASARKVMEYSTDVWEANLIAARVLQRNGQIAEAEDAILTNLDISLEESQSTVFLASLYYFAREEEKLVRLLSDETMVARLPAPVILRCAALVGEDQTPADVMRKVQTSLEAYPRTTLGSEQLMLRVGYAWQLHLAKMELLQNGVPLAQPQVAVGRGYHDLYFSGKFGSNPLTRTASAGDLTFRLTYPDQTVVTLKLADQQTNNRLRLGFVQSPAYRISDIRIGDNEIAVHKEACLDLFDSPFATSPEFGDLILVN